MAEVHSDSLFPFPAWADDRPPVVFDQTALSAIEQTTGEKRAWVGRLALTTSRAGRN